MGARSLSGPLAVAMPKVGVPGNPRPHRPVSGASPRLSHCACARGASMGGRWLHGSLLWVCNAMVDIRLEFPE